MGDTEDTTVDTEDTTDTDIPDTDTPDTGARGTLKPTLLPNPRLMLRPIPPLTTMASMVSTDTDTVTVMAMAWDTTAVTPDTTDTPMPDTDTDTDTDTWASVMLKLNLRLMPNPMLMLGGIMAVTTVMAVPTTVETTTVDTTVMADGGKCYFSISQDPNTLLSFRKRRQQHPNSIFATNFISPKIFFLNWK